mmetsp:Transcript_749/g.2490  ORF Transcript_749/g.2490 Transcript_749/m.2490 type:complete len:307 (-) Transcript_749:110-1030(-)|eukprot:CAMPEP_0117454014 /NCGR_PEP_ID=MMETSP0759-20121206/10562_1 /TAXON_ID=63605 /ORGANISM="Percolomonas cosmopolitus, Strain WS" /LENGTH=306 /DNA_ID=CAMNT_0005247147 /DNA_START=93 /DNA_END=1013 /DNA_ORIENTATION=-
MTLPLAQQQSQQQQPCSPSSTSFPCLIREILFAPNAPSPSISHLLEVALTHHNTSNYQLAIQTYLTAQREWYDVLRERDRRLAGGGGSTQDTSQLLSASVSQHDREQNQQTSSQKPLSQQIPISAYLFFRLAIGSVYESAGNDELALQQYMDAKRHAEQNLPKDHPDRALTYSCIAQIYFHLREFEMARTFFNRARELRVVLQGVNHVDSAVSYNNVAVCLHALGEFQEAISLYNKAMIVFRQELGINHPRSTVVQRNISMTKQRFLRDFAWEETSFGELYLPIAKKKAAKKGKKGKKKGGKKKKK